MAVDELMVPVRSRVFNAEWVASGAASDQTLQASGDTSFHRVGLNLYIYIMDVVLLLTVVSKSLLHVQNGEFESFHAIWSLK